MANRPLLDAIREFYNSRVNTYDNLQWHSKLAEDVVSYAKIKPGDSVLDLCSGTGLVTLRAAERVGPDGRVIAVDIADQFQSLARQKALASNHNNTTFHLHDVMALSTLFQPTHSFNAITCCSSFVLLPHPLSTLQSWSQYLAPTGVLVFDVITETSAASQVLFMKIANKHFPGQVHHDRKWVTGRDAVEKLVAKAGLRMKKLVVSESYDEYEESWEDAAKIWERMCKVPLYGMTREKGEERLEEAKKEFLEEFGRRADADGKWRQHIKLYIVIATL